MELEEIIGHIVAGGTIYWKSPLYKVEAWHTGMMIVCQTNGHALGLTWTDGVTLNGDEKDFYVGETKCLEN